MVSIDIRAKIILRIIGQCRLKLPANRAEQRHQMIAPWPILVDSVKRETARRRRKGPQGGYAAVFVPKEED